MGDRPHRDPVDAGLRDLTDRFEGDATGCLEEQGAATLISSCDRRTHGLGIHVVEQHHVHGARRKIEDLLELLEAIDFDLDEPGPHLFPSRRHRGFDRLTRVRTDAHQMVVLHEDRVIEPDSMERSTTGANRVLLDRPETGRGLSRVDDRHPRSLDRPHELVRPGRDTGRASQQVQQGSFDGKQRRERTPELHHPGPPLHAITVHRKRLGFDDPRSAGRDPADDRQAADDSFLSGSDLRPDLDVRRDEGLRGDVADLAEVLDQPSFDGRLERRLDQSLEELRE